ncbi:hypothetical protein BH09BAC6_BH09BAC6_13090 [soil metagenome]|jgi:hypothetical protein
MSADKKIRVTHVAGKTRIVKRPRSVLQTRTATVSRWLHIYLSMVSLAIILFFAVTGLTLNHADWFGGKPRISKYTGAMNSKWVKTKDTLQVAKLKIVEFLRKTNGIKGAVSDFRIEDAAVSVSFNGPGYAADAFINRDDGQYKLTETRLGLVAILNDLHKGRDTGKGWSWVIDVAAIFMTLVSLTGIVMICFMKKKRLNGLLMVVAGLAVVYLVYLFFVK